MNNFLYNEHTSDVESETSCRKTCMAVSDGSLSYIHNSLFYHCHIKASFLILSPFSVLGVFHGVDCICVHFGNVVALNYT